MATKPATKQLNSKQKEILARKLGYDGPMNMFEQFIKSDPAMSAKYSTVVEKFMARGGMAKKYASGGVIKMAAGGAVPPTWPSGVTRFGNLDSKVAKGVPLTAEEQKSVNYFGGVDKYLAASNEYDKNYAQYLIDYYQEKYDANPNSANTSRLARAFEKAAKVPGFSSAQVKDFTSKASTLSSQVDSLKEAETQQKTLSSSGKTVYDDLYNRAVDARDKAFNSAVQTRDTTRANADKKLQDALDEIDRATKDGTVTPEQANALRTQARTQHQAIRETATKNFDAATKAITATFESNKSYASGIRSDIETGKAAVDSQYTFPGTESAQLATVPEFKPLDYEAAKQQAPVTTPTPAQSGPAQKITPEPVVAQQPNIEFTGLPEGTPNAFPPAETTSGPVKIMTPEPVAPTTTPTTTPTIQQFAAGSPVATPQIPQVEAQKIEQTPEQLVTTQGAPEQAATVQPSVVSQLSTAAPVAPKEAATVTAATATPGVSTALQDVRPVTGVVSPEAQVQAQTMEPTSTKVSDLAAATGEAALVQAPAARTVQEGELVAGPTVDMGRVEETLSQAQAAQGEVTPEMTVQYQLQQLTEGFDATNPPPWASGAIRSVNAELARRGIGASSMAGQAIIQTALETALPIAAADAATFKEMGIQNLSNRQQMAVLTAQQRAAFLGQEFDQAFQTRVTNAATISEIANINFTAEQQIALENARLTNTVNLANLSNQQALVIAEAAQIANLETANLNNRQQAAVLNAQAFLQMDMANLANEQQTELFKAQSMVNSLLTDAAAENAARQFNASSINQVNQFYDGLTTQINQFNASQANAMNQFNVSQVNAVAQFNAGSQNARDQFNAEFRKIIDQSNAEWRRNIALADTAAINRANEINAAAVLGITTIDYNNQWQTTRDIMEMSWKTGESALDRENQLAMQVLQKQATIEAAKYQVEVAKYEALGGLAAASLGNDGLVGVATALGLTKAATSGGAGSAPGGKQTAAEKIVGGADIDTLPKYNGAVFTTADDVAGVRAGISQGALTDDYYSPEYMEFIGGVYDVDPYGEQAQWLADQDAWFYDGL